MTAAIVPISQALEGFHNEVDRHRGEGLVQAIIRLCRDCELHERCDQPVKVGLKCDVSGAVVFDVMSHAPDNELQVMNASAIKHYVKGVAQALRIRVQVKGWDYTSGDLGGYRHTEIRFDDLTSAISFFNALAQTQSQKVDPVDPRALTA